MKNVPTLKNWKILMFGQNWPIFPVEYPGEPVPGFSQIWYHWNRLAMGFNQTVWPNKSSNKWASCGPKFEKNPEFWPKNGKTVRFWAGVAQPFMMGFGSSKWFFNRAVQTYLCQKTSLSLTLTLFSQMWKNWKFALWKIHFWGFSLKKSTKIKKIIFKLITLPRAKFHIL